MGAGEKQAGRWLRELSTMCSPDLYSYHRPTFEFEKDYTLCSNTQGPRMQWGTHLRQSSFKLNSLCLIMGNPYQKRSNAGLNGPPADTRTCVTIVAGCIGLIPIQRRRIWALLTPSGGPPLGVSAEIPVGMATHGCRYCEPNLLARHLPWLYANADHEDKLKET